MHATEIILPTYASHRFCAVATFSVFAGFTPASFAAPMHEIMLLTGQSNPYHDWTRSSPLAGVDMASFAPKFSDYAPVVVVDKGADWLPKSALNPSGETESEVGLDRGMGVSPMGSETSGHNARSFTGETPVPP